MGRAGIPRQREEFMMASLEIHQQRDERSGNDAFASGREEPAHREASETASRPPVFPCSVPTATASGDDKSGAGAGVTRLVRRVA